MSVAALARTAAFRDGFRYLEAGYYWEAHEAWEPVWQALPPNSAARQFVQGVIQLANAELKLRMQRPSAAARLCAIAARHLAEARRGASPRIMGVDAERVAARIAACASRAGQA
jgi:predicted metal-dependent hydrolase